MQIEVPYRIAGGGIGRKPGREQIAWIPVALASVSKGHAPVAIRMVENGRGRVFREYRLHDGRLWERAMDVRQPLSDYVSKKGGGRLRLDHPLLPKRGDGARWSMGSDYERVALPDDDEHRAVADAMARIAANSLLIDGVVHRRSTGPLYMVRDQGLICEWWTGINMEHGWPYDGRLFALPMHLRDVAEDAIDRFGEAGADDFSDHHPLVLIDHVQDYDPLANAQEAFAWAALWAVRRKPLGALGAEAVAALSRLRGGLEDRWPGHGVDLEGTCSQRQMWPHDMDRVDYPDGRHVADLGIDLIREASHVLGPLCGRQARFMECFREALEDRLGVAPAGDAVDGRDAAALAGLGV